MERHAKTHKPPKGSVTFVPKREMVVLIKEPNAPRSKWSFGQIIRLGKRQATVHVQSDGVLKERSINLLFSLEIPMDNQDEEGPSASKELAGTGTDGPSGASTSGKVTASTMGCTCPRASTSAGTSTSSC